VTERNNERRPDIVYSTKIKAGRRRTYFFDVRKTKGGDYYITMTESTRRLDGEGFNRHKIFLYKEDFNKFLEGLEEVIDHVKSELLPDYDYDAYQGQNHDEEFSPDSDQEIPSEEDIKW